MPIRNALSDVWARISQSQGIPPKPFIPQVVEPNKSIYKAVMPKFLYKPPYS